MEIITVIKQQVNDMIVELEQVFQKNALGKQELNKVTVIISSSTTDTGSVDEPPVDETPPDKLLSIVIIEDIITTSGKFF